jgi:hypothetical protein
MQVTASTSFSITTSTEGMPMAATENDYFSGSKRTVQWATVWQEGIASGHLTPGSPILRYRAIPG